MNTAQQPLVSVVTPVYNGEAYLRECVESVLSQTYLNWEYIIVDNVSNDDTLRIATELASKDKRIRVHRSDVYLPIIANHNRAVGLIAPEARFCKIVSADDRLMPDCLRQMVELMEANPSIGIVGSYQVSGGDDEWRVRNTGLPCFRTVFSGREIGRAHLLGSINVLGNPTSSCYRADLVRKCNAFFPNEMPEADVSACVAQLRTCDFGFVHQVLSYERCHRTRETTARLALNAYVSAEINDCMTYGMDFMTKDERDGRVAQLLEEYYRYLSVNALKLRERAFWRHHKRRLQEIGYPFDRIKLARGIGLKLTDLFFNPKSTIWLVRQRMRHLAGARPDFREERPGSMRRWTIVRAGFRACSGAAERRDS